MDLRPTVILGCGYTGERLARRLLERGAWVLATSRDPRTLADLAALGARVAALDAGDARSLGSLAASLPDQLSVVHSIPPTAGPGGRFDPTPRLLDAFGLRIHRAVYLSSASVYGGTRFVDEHTLPAPETEAQHLRVAAEARVLGGAFSGLVLRPAAIYGPGRGVHARMQAGSHRLVGDGSNLVSCIHVDDLVAHVEAALEADLEGALPVADETPAKACEVAAFCAQLLDLPMPPSVTAESVGTLLRVTRSVDGRAARRALGVELAYPSFRQGIPAALEEEAGGAVAAGSTPAFLRR